ncbi:MAG TPA: hypothetical protein VH969_23295 [Actinophytocola sp.]|uniref:hypothetical protein n=1 Tax=Actinophytocola sp. TaxID=1872138 RepID=UPI002F9399FC
MGTRLQNVDGVLRTRLGGHYHYKLIKGSTATSQDISILRNHIKYSIGAGYAVVASVYGTTTDLGG